MAKWLFKSEPDVFGWTDLVAKDDAGEEWDGVRNYQARNFMRDMAVGDLGFFYHSRSGLEIVGIVEVITAAHQDSTTDDTRWDCVDVKAVRPFVRPVSLEPIKTVEDLSEMALVKSSRLSVGPVTEDAWNLICEMGQTKP